MFQIHYKICLPIIVYTVGFIPLEFIEQYDLKT